jgi:tRNA (mo5U34)-methyltransferase
MGGDPRAVFRSWCPQGRGSSSLPARTREPRSALLTPSEQAPDENALIGVERSEDPEGSSTMAHRTLRLGEAAVTVEIPSRWAAPLRRVVKRHEGDGAAALGRLVVRDHLPSLDVQRHDVDESMRFWRDAYGTSTTAAHREQRDGEVPGTASSDLQHRVDSVVWYQTIELPDGVVTAGVFDHRPLVPHYGIPPTLEGARVLDVASSDGFWAFEFERRGAREVVSLDVGSNMDWDLPPELKAQLVAEGLVRRSEPGFEIAREALGSSVQRIEGSVYDLDPAVHGVFDFVHCSDVLLHLQDPFAALRAIRRVCSHEALLVDGITTKLSGRVASYVSGGWYSTIYWLPTTDTLAQMVLDCGFATVALHNIYNLAATNEPVGIWRAALRASI